MNDIQVGTLEHADRQFISAAATAARIFTAAASPAKRRRRVTAEPAGGRGSAADAVGETTATAAAADAAASRTPVDNAGNAAAGIARRRRRPGQGRRSDAGGGRRRRRRRQVMTGGAATVGGKFVGPDFDVDFALDLGVGVDGPKGEPSVPVLILTQFLPLQRHFAQRLGLFQTAIVDVIVEAPKRSRNLALELLGINLEGEKSEQLVYASARN